MAHFSQAYLDFFKGLSRNNKREWYHAHKADYERYVKQPFQDFVEELIHRIAALDPEVSPEPKDAIFRIARDTRFSKNKTPYKVFMAARIAPGGRRLMSRPGFFFKMGADGVGIGGGMHAPDREEVALIRTALAKGGKRFDRLLQGKAFREIYGELQGERNKRLPKEFAAAAERYPYIANKQFYYMAEYDDPRLVLRDDLAAFVMRHYKAGRKVSEFLGTAVS
jgi:uncharacterized protein (TIGR02453 family)